MNRIALLCALVERTEEEKRGERWVFMGICKKERIHFDVNDLSQNIRRLNFPERKFTKREPQISFRS